MQRTRFPQWTATLSLVALGPLALSLPACSKEEPKPGAGETAAAQAQGQVTPAPEAAAPSEAPPAEPPATPDVSTSEAKEAAGAEAPAKPEAEATKPAEEGAPEQADEKAAAAKGAEEKPAAEAHAAEAKKPAKKKGDKGEEAPAKEAKPKLAELAVKVTKAGQGTAATEGSTVTLHYKASVIDAEKPFDSTYATRRPIEVRLGEGAKLAVIEGLRRGLEGLTPGTEARLEIPASLAWGEKGNPAVGVPANADVVFEITVLDVR